jgi:hypothetical protein
VPGVLSSAKVVEQLLLEDSPSTVPDMQCQTS